MPHRRRCLLIYAMSCTHQKAPPKSRFQRSTLLISFTHIQPLRSYGCLRLRLPPLNDGPHSETSCRVTTMSGADPHGSIPKWVVNVARCVAAQDGARRG